MTAGKLTGFVYAGQIYYKHQHRLSYILPFVDNIIQISQILRNAINQNNHSYLKDYQQSLEKKNNYESCFIIDINDPDNVAWHDSGFDPGYIDWKSLINNSEADTENNQNILYATYVDLVISRGNNSILQAKKKNLENLIDALDLNEDSQTINPMEDSQTINPMEDSQTINPSEDSQSSLPDLTEDSQSLLPSEDSQITNSTDDPNSDQITNSKILEQMIESYLAEQIDGQVEVSHSDQITNSQLLEQMVNPDLDQIIEDPNIGPIADPANNVIDDITNEENLDGVVIYTFHDENE